MAAGHGRPGRKDGYCTSLKIILLSLFSSTYMAAAAVAQVERAGTAGPSAVEHIAAAAAGRMDRLDRPVASQEAHMD